MVVRTVLTACLLLATLDISTVDSSFTECCTVAEIAAFRSNWEDLWASNDSGSKKIIIGRSIFARMFEKMGETRELFKRVNVDNIESPEFAAHCVRVMNAIDVYVNLLHTSEVLFQYLEHLRQQHVARGGVKPEHFQVFAESVTEILIGLLGTPESMAVVNCLSALNSIFRP